MQATATKATACIFPATPSCYQLQQATAPLGHCLLSAVRFHHSHFSNAKLLLCNAGNSLHGYCLHALNCNTKLQMASAGNGPTWPLLAISRSNAKLLPSYAGNSPHGYCLHSIATPSCCHRLQATAPTGHCLQLSADKPHIQFGTITEVADLEVLGYQPPIIHLLIGNGDFSDCDDRPSCFL